MKAATIIIIANKPFNICCPVNVTGFVVTKPCNFPKAIRLPVKVNVPTNTLKVIEMIKGIGELEPCLKNSDVALKIEGTTKKLTITAPNAKGDAPKDDSPLLEKIQYTLITEISPRLASHGGFCELVEITKKKEVVLNFGGGCQGCSSVAITLKDGIERELMGLYPEIVGILDVTDHTDKSNAYM